MIDIWALKGLKLGVFYRPEPIKSPSFETSQERGCEVPVKGSYEL
jgi:hypothetical protein